MELINKFLTFYNQVKILHWQTISYAEHKALDGLYDDLGDNIDSFVESYMGKYGRVIAEDNFAITLVNYSALSPEALLDQMDEFLIEDLPEMLDEEDTDLLNIRDEILGDVKKTRYLLTLN
jgi:DNA-binding ferritin-like protein